MRFAYLNQACRLSSMSLARPPQNLIAFIYSLPETFSIFCIPHISSFFYLTSYPESRAFILMSGVSSGQNRFQRAVFLHVFFSCLPWVSHLDVAVLNRHSPSPIHLSNGVVLYPLHMSAQAVLLASSSLLPKLAQSRLSKELSSTFPSIVLEKVCS